MFVHNVFFWLKEKDNEEARKALLAGIKSLEAIESIESVYIGTPASTRRPVIDATYTRYTPFIRSSWQTAPTFGNAS